MNWLEYIAFTILRLLRRLHLARLIRIGSKRNFNDYFKNFDKNEAVKEMFGEKTEEVLRNLKVEFMGLFGYMGVDNTDGHLLVNVRYLETGDKVDIYLDVIHELCHVKQYMEGKELFDARYDYVDRTTGPRTFWVFKKTSPSKIETGRRITELRIACCGFNPNAKTRWGR